MARPPSTWWKLLLAPISSSESLLSLHLRSGAAMAQMLAGLPGANKEKRFSSHETDLAGPIVKSERTIIISGYATFSD